MGNIAVLMALGIESIADIKTKSLSVVRLIIYFVLAVGANIIWKYQTLFSMLGGIGVGIIVLLWGLITKESIGYGDGFLIVCIGAAIGLNRNLGLVLFSMLLAAFTGGIYAIIKKKNLKMKMPFVPCVFLTFLIMTILRFT